MANADPTPIIPSSETLENLAEQEPYKPYMDVAPPSGTPISDANGTIQSAEELEAQAEREATPEPTDFAIKFPAHLPQPPFVHVQGVPNFRDLGGYRCGPPSSGAADGSSSATYAVRTGVLYRCAHPTHLTQAGADEMVGKLGVTTLYDLRSQPEITRLASTVANDAHNLYPLANPNSGCIDDVPGLTRRFVPVYATEDYGPVALARKLSWYTDASVRDGTAGYEYSEGFVKAYRDIATHGATAYTAIFRHLLDRPGEALVFHCTAGKDRTGVFGALVLRLVGVDDETICWEYALTEPGLGEWRKQFIERISASGLGGGGASSPSNPSSSNNATKLDSGGGRSGDMPALSREEAARICGSRAGNLRRWLQVVLDGEFGGVENYLGQYCGLSAEEVVRLRDALVVQVADESKVVKPVGIDGWTPDGGVVD